MNVFWLLFFSFALLEFMLYLMVLLLLLSVKCKLYRLFGRHNSQTMLCQKGHCNFCKVSKDQKSPTQHVQELSSLNFVVDKALRMIGTEKVLTFWDCMKSSKFVLILQY